MKPAEWDHLVDGRGIKEIELARIQDEHYYMVRLAHDPEADKRPERLHSAVLHHRTRRGRSPAGAGGHTASAARGVQRRVARRALARGTA